MDVIHYEPYIRTLIKIKKYSLIWGYIKKERKRNKISITQITIPELTIIFP